MKHDLPFERLARKLRAAGVESAADASGACLFERSGSAFEAVFSPAAPPEAASVESVLRLMELAPGASKAAAFPDLHPSSKAMAPVGSAVLLPRFAPAIIGSDVNCGVLLGRLDGFDASAGSPLPAAAKAALRELFCEGRRSVPMSEAAFGALFSEGADACLDELRARNPGGAWARADFKILSGLAAGAFDGLPDCSSADAPEALVRLGKRELIRDPSLATLGGGNHFAEIQAVDATLRPSAWAAGLRKGSVCLMLHSGSRAAGFFAKALADARCKAPPGRLFMAPDDATSLAALRAASAASRWAWLNRLALALCAEAALASALGREVRFVPICHASHNCATLERGGVLHRKGAAKAHPGALVPVPGSCGDYSWVLEALGSDALLDSCAHGAGRAFSRSDSWRADSAPEPLFPDFEIVCLDPRRAREEAPRCYRPSSPAVRAQACAGVAEPAARMAPLCTFKA